MNQTLNEKLKEIESIGEKMMVLDAAIAKNREKLAAIENAGKDLADLPAAQKALSTAIAEIQKEIDEETASLNALKAKLPQ